MSNFYSCIFLTVIFPLFCYGVLEQSLGLPNVHLAHNFTESSRRAKRTDDSCAKTCDLVMKRDSQKYTPELSYLAHPMELENDANSLTALSKPQFQSMCKHVLKPASHCIDKCHSLNPYTELFRKSMGPAKFLCVNHYDDVSNNYECMKRTQSISRGQCEHGSCKHLNHASGTLAQRYKLLTQNRDLNGARKLVADYCDYASCMMHCERPIISRTCGDRWGNVIGKDFLRTTLQTKKEILEVNHIKGLVWPPNCDRTLFDTFYGSASKPVGVMGLVSLLLAVVLQLH